MEASGIVSGKSVFGVLPASKSSCDLYKSRVVIGKVPFFGRKSGSCGGGIRDLCGGLRSGFGDEGHVSYYNDGHGTCVIEGGNRKKKKKTKEEEGRMYKGKMVKKRMKLLEGLTRDLGMFIEMGVGVDADVDDVDQGKKISESAETLLKHLELLKAEVKQLKRRKKEEKAVIELEPSSSSSSSESSDGDCDEVVDMIRLKESCTKQLQEEPQQTTTAQTLVTVEAYSTNLPMAKEKLMSCNSAQQLLSDNATQPAPTTTRIEVCMGNKCKKSGSLELLAEFERVVGKEGAVGGCKCLGKCRDGPNVRVLNCPDKNHAESAVLDDSVRTPSNPLCIGVGLEDVGVIVANFLVKEVL